VISSLEGVLVNISYLGTYIPDSEVQKTGGWEGQISHVFRELLEVVLLLLDLLPELDELLPLGLADEQLLVGALALLEGISVLVGNNCVDVSTCYC